MSPEDEADLRRLVLAEYHRTHEMQGSGCDGKASFDSPDLAREVAKRTRDIHGRLMTYRCRYCGSWHIGNHLSPAAANRRPKAKESQRSMA
jgi:hypothetical protein